MATSTSTISRKEYLKRYLSNFDREARKSKKKLISRSLKKSRCKIVDDDVDIKSIIPSKADVNDIEVGEDAPQVAEIIDERPLEVKVEELYRQSKKWKRIDDNNGETNNHKNLSSDGNFQRARQEYSYDMSPSRKRNDSDSDSSVTRFQKRDYESITHRKQKHDIYESPPRRKAFEKQESSHLSSRNHPQYKSDLNIDRTTKSQKMNEHLYKRLGNEASSYSPRSIQESYQSSYRKDPDDSVFISSSRSGYSSPKRHKYGFSSQTSDPSLQRRQRHDSDNSPPGRLRDDYDQSPSRRERHDSDQSLPRRQRHDSDQSSPRRQRHDSDPSPPGRQRYHSPHRRERHDSDQSLPREDYDSDQSLSRREREPFTSIDRKQNNRSNQYYSSAARTSHCSDLSPSRKGRIDKSPTRRSIRYSDQLSPRGSRYDSDQSPPRKRYSADRSPPSRRDQYLDLSPPRKQRFSTEQSSSGRHRIYSGQSFSKGHRYDSDTSPPRRTYDTEHSPARYRYTDQSPPRQDRYDSDQSPPRKQKYGSDLSPSRRYNTSSEIASHKRQRHDSDEFSYRRSKYDTDKHKHKNFDSVIVKREQDDSDDSISRRDIYNVDDLSPRRQKYSSQSQRQDLRYSKESRKASPRRFRHDSDDSLDKETSYLTSRKYIEKDKLKAYQHKNSDPYLSPSNKYGKPHSDSGHSSSSVRKVTFDMESSKKSHLEDGSLRLRKPERTLDGKRAGLQDAITLREENEAARKREKEMFSQLSEETSGRGAATIVRSRATGRKIDVKEERRKLRAEEARKAEQEEKYMQWGKGLKQQEMKTTQLRDDMYEMSKPLARYKDDEDLDRELREQEREGDPMLVFLKKKKRSHDKKKKTKPVYQGPPPPPNRYGIMPGYRWDGVDRSNGFERERFARLASKKAKEEEIYNWSVENM